MTKRDIAKALKKVANDQAFMTCTELCKALGVKNRARVRERYLLGLPTLDGKYYLIDEVAESLEQHVKW